MIDKAKLAAPGAAGVLAPFVSWAELITPVMQFIVLGLTGVWLLVQITTKIIDTYRVGRKEV